MRVGTHCYGGRYFLALCGAAVLFCAAAPAVCPAAPAACAAKVPGQTAAGAKPKHEAYLFAHMIHSDYGRLYYTVSLDGLHWTALNGGQRVFNDYQGHPDICCGHDGRYYLVGNLANRQPEITFWVSDDLLKWAKYSTYTPDLAHVPNYPHALMRVGAPKIYYDAATKQYLVTWHTSDRKTTPKDPKDHWIHQRTLYSLSKDLQEFSNPPRRLFSWEMATIDVLVRREGDRYFAIIKDERWPAANCQTGKTIRVCTAPSLLGPYSEPSDSVSLNYREAPTLIPAPNGAAWYLYYERYPGIAYEFAVAEHLQGPWQLFPSIGKPAVQNHCSLPPKVRHGTMIPITRKQYDALVTAFGK